MDDEKPKTLTIIRSAEIVESAPGGQPTKYKIEYCDQLIEHMEKGFSFESFGGKIRVCSKTLYNWSDTFPEFLQAKRMGENASRLFWENVLLENVVTRRESYYEDGNLVMRQTQLNAQAYALAMRNLHKWRMKDDVDNADQKKKEPLKLAYDPKDIKLAKELKDGK